MEDNILHPDHETLEIPQAEMTELEEQTMQDSNCNTTTAVCISVKEEPLDRVSNVESPVIVQEASSVDRICSIPVSGETVEISAAGSTPGTMLVTSSRPGEIPIIVPSGKTIFLPDQFTAVLIRPESLLYGMEVPVMKKENSEAGATEHVIAVSHPDGEAAGSATEAGAATVQVPWFLQVGHNAEQQIATVTTEDGETKEVTVEPLITAPDAASATPKTPYMFTSKDRTFTCEFCPNITFTRGQLRKHKSVHTGQRNYVCGVCNKRFAVKHSLVKHMVLHSGQSPFTCEQCGKGFSTAYHLQHHARSHDPERQYKCSQCDKMFAKPDHLVVHVRTHSGEETFPCTECDKSFTTKLGLNTHMRVHAGDGTGGSAVYTCGLCGLQLANYSELAVHAKTHGEQEQAALVGAHECVVIVEEDRTRTQAIMSVVTSLNGVSTA